jgi:hypothetical protein
MRLVLNELSLRSSCKTIEDGHKLMQEFLENYTEMDRLISRKGVILMEAFHNLKLTQDYSIHNWFEDKRVEKRLKDKYRSLLNRSQYVNEDDYCNSEFNVIEFHPKTNAIGCLVAYEREEFVISLRTHELWDEDTINGVYFSVKNDFKYDEPINVSILNISCKLHVIGFSQNVIKDIYPLICSGQDLWEKKELLYPHLVFCESVKDQLILDTEKIHIEQIMKRLRKMEEYFSNFDGNFDCNKFGLGARSESESVVKNDEYKQQRVIRTPYGEDRAFYWHIGFAGKFPGRIHFFPDSERKNCLIGYIGKHLPTPMYSTI